MQTTQVATRARSHGAVNCGVFVAATVCVMAAGAFSTIQAVCLFASFVLLATVLSAGLEVR